MVKHVGSARSVSEYAAANVMPGFFKLSDDMGGPLAFAPNPEVMLLMGKLRGTHGCFIRD